MGAGEAASFRKGISVSEPVGSTLDVPVCGSPEAGEAWREPDMAGSLATANHPRADLPHAQAEPDTVTTQVLEGLGGLHWAGT